MDIFMEYYGQAEITNMIQNNIIEISPLGYMRGRTFKNAFIIADEMQNSSPNQMLMLLTRIGINSKMVITGDLAQSDKSENNGLKDLIYNNEDDFTPIGTIIVTPNVLVVNNNLPVKTFDELVAYGKGAGKNNLSFASAGPGSTGHLSGQILMNATGLNMVHVPYKSSGQAFPDVISGQVSMVFDSLPSAIGFIRGGLVRPLLVMSEKRSPSLPGVQTAKEAGFPSATMNFWMGIEAPAKLPKEIVYRLNLALKEAMNTPEMRQHIQPLGAEVYLTTPDEFKALRHSDIEKYGKLVKEMGLKPL
jgi:tripartite-type tricarboxylate transporter receptor subunit TctC